MILYYSRLRTYVLTFCLTDLALKNLSHSSQLLVVALPFYFIHSHDCSVLLPSFHSFISRCGRGGINSSSNRVACTERKRTCEVNRLFLSLSLSRVALLEQRNNQLNGVLDLLM